VTQNAKQKLFNSVFIFLGLWPLAYLLAFLAFFYSTGNGFAKALTYNPDPSKKKTYLNWLQVIQSLENLWMIAFALWVLAVIASLLFGRSRIKKRLILITTALFMAAIYLNFFSVYGIHEGWIDDYRDAVTKINHS